jgi:hypothetical protein
MTNQHAQSHELVEKNYKNPNMRTEWISKGRVEIWRRLEIMAVDSILRFLETIVNRIRFIWPECHSKVRSTSKFILNLQTCESCELAQLSDQLLTARTKCLNLESVNATLVEEVGHLRSECHLLEKKLSTLQTQIERTNEMKEVVNLCKLVVAGSMVPVASVLLFFALIDGSLFVQNI